MGIKNTDERNVLKIINLNNFVLEICFTIFLVAL